MSNNHHWSQFRSIRVCGLVFLGILVVFALVRSAVVAAPDELAYVRKVRSIETQQLGVADPLGLAFSPKANALLIVGGQRTEGLPLGRSDVVMVDLLRRPMGSLRIGAGIADPLNICFSLRAHALIALDKAANQLVKIRAKTDGRLDPSEQAVIHSGLGRFPIQNPEGIASDPETGDLYVLDSAGPRICRLIPGPGQDFNRAGIEWIPVPALRSTGTAWPGRIAFNPESRHLYVFDPAGQKLFELTETGSVASVRDLSFLKLAGPQAMVFAPSGDQTDKPSIMSLYIADSGVDPVRGKSRGRVVELSLTAPVLSASFLAAQTIPGTLVNTIDTSLWVPPSPDPSGMGYNPTAGTYWVSDSEVEGTTVYANVNLFEMSPAGTLLNTYTTDESTGPSKEPTGIAWNSNSGHVFISDDDWGRVFEVDLGPDLIFGTGDDVWSYVTTSSYGSLDPEGVCFDSDNERLLIVDGTNAEVYVVTAGPNGVFDGIDDEVTHFDTAGLGLTTSDGIAYSPDSDTVYLAGPAQKTIVEATMDGTAVRIIDDQPAGVIAAAGLGWGPAGADPSKRSIYLADRAHDPSEDPSINDGKIFEFSITWPVIPSFSPTSGNAGTAVTLTGRNFTGATDVSFNGVSATFTVDSDTKISTSVPAGATTGKISVTTAVGTGASRDEFTVKPPKVTSFSPTSGVVGTAVTLTGTGFTGATNVAFNGTAATFTVDSGTKISTSVPAGATTGKISVTTPSGTGTSNEDFAVLVPPTVTSFDPTNGPVGTPVTLTGTHFTGATNVAFNGTAATYTVDSDIKISTTVPAGATTGKISVTTPAGTGTSSSDFTITGPQIKVTAPNASSSWQKGTTQTITWLHLGNQAAKVNIRLFLNNVLQRTIALGTPNDGSFDWKIPTDLKAQSGYVVRVKTTDGKVKGDSQSFKIITASIKVTAPAAGAAWGRNTTQTITWTSKGTMNSNVKIDLFRGTTLVQAVVATTPNNGSYSWTIPGSLARASDYKIRIRTVDNAVTAKSGQFKIT